MSDAPPRRGLRSFGAVFAGLVVIVVLSTVTDLALYASRIFPPENQPKSNALWLLATGYRVVFSILGCYLAARLAPDRPMRHAMVLGVVGLIVCTLGLVLTWNRGPEFGPHWYPIGLVVTALPCAWLGGKLRR